jgi:tetratricopeptide (TPR) repeat protein
MAKKRLNKKVALIGLVVLAVFLLGVVAVVLRFRKNPLKFLAAAEAALAQYDYEGTERNYGQAYGCAKDDDLKIEILFKIADFHLINDKVHEHEPDWLKALGCWNTVINIDPKNIKSRMAILKYFYESGDAGNPGAWQRVEKDASELAEVIDEKLLEPDLYVLLARARAKLEIAALGQTTEREKSLEEAVSELESLRELTPENIDIYMYLARAATVIGEIENSKGVLDATRRAAEKTKEILQNAIDVAPDNAKAHVNLLEAKLLNVFANNENVQALEGDFESLVEKFSASAEVYMSLAKFYQLNIKDIDKAVKAIEKAVELDSTNADYAMASADIYYRKSSINKDKESFSRAVEIVNNALNLPEVQDVQGPRQFKHRQNRYALFTSLSTWYIEQAFEADQAGNEEQKLQWIGKAEETIHEIEQFIGTEDNVYVMKWHGMLALVKGDKTSAIRQMYSAYEQLKAGGQRDASLSYMLSRVFEGKAEIGARHEFLESALLTRPSIALQKPEALLDYAEVLLELRATRSAITAVDVYEKTCSVTDRSKLLRIRGYINTNQLNSVEELLSQVDASTEAAIEQKISFLQKRIDRINTARKKKKLDPDEGQGAETAFFKQAEMGKYREELRKSLKNLLEKKPEQNVAIALCDSHVRDGQIDQARSVIDEFLAHSPDNISAQIYQRQLSEPDPKNISKERLNQIREDVVVNISDELERCIRSGQYYLSRNQTEKAMVEFKKAYEMAPGEKRAVGILFDIALLSKDMVLAEQIVEEVRKKNLDDCEGNLFAARLDISREDFQNASNRLSKCLEMLPIFPNGYLLRSQVNNNIGNYDEAISDAKMAYRLNPTDAGFAKQLAATLYNRNLRLGRSVSSEQIAETEQALGMAIVLNPDDWSLRSINAEYISEREPAKALAARQRLLARFPNVDNSLMLGNMAMRMALKETDKQRKAGLFEIAGSAYEKACKMEPDNKAVLDAYSEFLRLTGHRDKAAELFKAQDDSLWKFYLRDGQYDKARDILEKLYELNPKDITVVKGLSGTAGKTADKEKIKRYSQELLALENTIDNELAQIQSYLEVGLLKEAELKLASFRERNPQETRGMLLEAWSAMTKGQLEKSLELVNRNLEIDSENAVAWRLRGQVNRLLGDFEQGVEDLQKSKNINANPRIRMELATAYQQVGKIEAAIGELTDALKDQQAPKRVRTMLEELYLQSGRKTELEKFYKDTLEKYPDTGFWSFRAGLFAFNQKNYEQAEGLLLKAWEASRKEGGYAKALDKYLETLWQMEKYKELLKYAAKYIDSPFAPIAYAQIAQAQFKMGSKATALDYYRKAIEKCGTNDELIVGILQNMSATVGPIEVTKWCNGRLRKNPASLAANLMMFKLHQQGRQYNKALGYIDKFLELVDPDSPVWIEQMFNKANTLTMAYIKTSDKRYISTAVSEFEKILAKQPKNADVLNNLAYFLVDSDEQLDKAVEYAKRAHEASPNKANNMDTYAYALCKVAEYAKAEELLQMAIQIFERESTAVPWDVYEHLGMAQEGLGRKAAAVASYRRALKIAGRKISKQEITELTEAIERVLQ